MQKEGKEGGCSGVLVDPHELDEEAEEILNAMRQEVMEQRQNVLGQKSAEEVIDALQKRLGINLPKERTIKNM